MKVLRLPEKNLNKFIESLKKFGEVHVPQRQGVKSFVFAELKDISKMDLNYTRTILPLKKYLSKPVDPLFRFTPTEGYQPTDEDKSKKYVLFGVHSCDIKALGIVDMVMRDNRSDLRYLSKRNNVAVIGISCEPDDFCFCHSMESDFVELGFELFLHKVDGNYLVIVRTSLGDDMVTFAASLFEEVTGDAIEDFKRDIIERRKKFLERKDINTSYLPEIIELEYKSKTWEEYGKKCLSCGSCTMVCPTCYCYEVYDEIALNQQEGTRKKRWDSCFFLEYSLVAGGINFRGEKSSRFRHRYLHKQEGFVSKYGRPSCVGCGRCIEVCPAKIDLREVIQKIGGEI